MLDEMLRELAGGPWAIPLMSALVFADSFFVVLPGEILVTALAALATTEGTPPLVLVVVTAAAAAFLGDLCCYLIGRLVAAGRWRRPPGPRLSRALAWARRRLDERTASVLFTARFIPFGRIAVNLAAGAGRIPAPRFLPLAAAASTAWACYQSFIGALVARLLPGAPAAAVLVSIGVALCAGFAVDAALARRRPRR